MPLTGKQAPLAIVDKLRQITEAYETMDGNGKAGAFCDLDQLVECARGRI